MKLSLPSVTPCCVCNEEAALYEMSRNRYSVDSDIFDPIFFGVERTNKQQYYTIQTKRVLATTSPNDMQICLGCEHKLKQKSIPKNALANGLDVGDVPDQLQGLSYQEQRMISIYVCCTTIVRMERSNTSQAGTIGGIAYVMNDLTSYCNTLPRPPSNLDIVYIRTTRALMEGTNPMVGIRTYEIRPYRIQNALIWLKTHNPLYFNIILDFTLLQEWATSQPLIKDFDADPLSDNSMPHNESDIGECPNTSCTEVLLDSLDVGDIVKDVSFLLPSSINDNMIPTPVSSAKVIMKDIPKLGYVKPFEDEYFWEKAFPWLFPYGIGGPTKNSRRLPLSDVEYDRHLMRESSRRFSTSFAWLAARYRYRTCQSSSHLAYVASTCTHNRVPTASDLQNLHHHTQNG